MIVTGIVAVLLALSGRAKVLAEISATLYMLTYALLALSVIIMRSSWPKWYDPKFRVPLYPVLPVAGGILALAVIVTMDRASQIAALVFIILSIIWYLIWVRRKTPVKGIPDPGHPLRFTLRTRTSHYSPITSTSTACTTTRRR